jgi:hypothetical protein
MWPLIMALLKSMREEHFGVKLELSWRRRRGRDYHISWIWNPIRVTYWLISLTAPQVHWPLEAAELNEPNVIWISLNFYFSISYKLTFLMLALKIRMASRCDSFHLCFSTPQFVCVYAYMCVFVCVNSKFDFVLNVPPRFSVCHRLHEITYTAIKLCKFMISW